MELEGVWSSGLGCLVTVSWRCSQLEEAAPGTATTQSGEVDRRGPGTGRCDCYVVMLDAS